MNRPKNKNFSSDGKKSTTQEFPNKKKGGDKERLSANKTITLYGWGKIPPQELFSPWMTRRKPKDSDKLCNVRFVHICLQFKDIATKLQ